MPLADSLYPELISFTPPGFRMDALARKGGADVSGAGDSFPAVGFGADIFEVEFGEFLGRDEEKFAA